jgi:hypothetical protein
MTYYIGKVSAVKGQRAQVIVERAVDAGTHVPRVLDCWNVCEAKMGARVRVERQTLDEKKGRWIVKGIPLLTLLAGAAFGRAVAPYFPIPHWQTVVASMIIWLLLGWNYARTFRRDVSHRGAQWSITGYYTEGALPEEGKP